MEKISEICCGSLEDALIATEVGASQIELNSSLYLGGLTPSFALIKSVSNYSDIDIVSMARPRPGGFTYNKWEYETLLQDSLELSKLPIRGVAFGCLSKDGHVDLLKSKKIVEILKGGNKEVVFHRAFDQVIDPFKAVEELIDLGVDRILTSGQKPQAIDGVDLLKKLKDQFSDKIQFIVGSGINSDNLEDIYRKTGISNFHSSCKKWRDEAYVSNNGVDYSYGIENKYEVTDFLKAKKFVEKIRNL